MKFVGIDPGASGAIAIIDGGTVQVLDTPFLVVRVGKTDRKRINPAELHRLLEEQVGLDGGAYAVVERVSPQPKFGASSMFWLGHSLGIWEAALSAVMVPYQTVTAQTWKKLYGINKDNRAKGQARQLAIRLFPQAAALLARVKDDGRAEALLLARWGQQTRQGMEVPAQIGTQLAL